MKEKNILSGSYNYENTLNIRVINIQALDEILSDIEIKRIELNNALERLREFNLEINFQVEKGE